MSTRIVSHFPLRGAAVRLAAVLLGAAGAVWTGGGVRAETWTDLSGTRSVEGKMVGMWGEQVILELNDGRRVGVAMDDLQAESRIQAKNLSEQISTRRSERVEELRAQAQVAAAPAPDPLPTPAPAPEYQPPSADLPVAEAQQQVIDQLRAGHLIALFDSMPPSYREDADAVVKQALAKIDPAAWKAVTDAASQIGDLIVTRQNWIFSHPRFEALPPETAESLKQLILPVAGILRDGFEPEAMALEKLRAMPLREWLAARDRAIAPHVFAMAERFSSHFPSPQVEVESEKEGLATVNVTQGDKTQTWVLKNVEGFWVSAAQADSWPKMIEDTKQRLESVPDGSVGGSVAQMLPSMLQPALEPLKSADNAAEFHAAMSSLFQSAAPAIQMAASMGGGQFNLGFGNQAGGGGPMQGYGGEMGGYGGEMDGYGGEMQGYGGEMDGYGEEMQGYGGEMDGYGGEMQGYGQQMQMRQQQYPGGSGPGRGNGGPGAGQNEEQMRRQQQRPPQQKRPQ